MMKLTTMTLAAAVGAGSALAQNMEVIKNGSQDGFIGEADKFTGTAYIEPVFSNTDPFVVNGGEVTFLPCAIDEVCSWPNR